MDELVQKKSPLRSYLRFCFVFVSFFNFENAQGQEPPATFTHTVSDGVVTHFVDFELHSARSPNFNVQIQESGGGFSAVPIEPVRTYLGKIDLVPGALAAAVRKSNGDIFWTVIFEDGRSWSFNGVFSDQFQEWQPNYPWYTATSGAGSNVYAAEVGIDVGYKHFIRHSTTADAIEMVEYSVSVANLVYLRDVGIINRLGRIVLRADSDSGPYRTKFGKDQLLPEMINQWNNILPASTHDLAAYVGTDVGGGQANVIGGIGDPAYSVNGVGVVGNFSGVWRHEAAHNWGLFHQDGGRPEGSTVNSNNQLSRFSGPEEHLIVNHRNAVATSVLDNLGPYTFSLPPRASLDAMTVSPQSPGEIIDVLQNDHDSNGDAISILAFQENSDHGGTVTRSVGTGPGGRDELIYLPPATPKATPDRFTYQIVDTTGREAEGNVIIRVAVETDFQVHFTFEETDGVEVFDSSSANRHGELLNGPVRVAGKFGKGLQFDGVDDLARVERLVFSSDEATFSAWIKRSGDQTNLAGILFNRGGLEVLGPNSQTTVSGLNFGSNNELRYHWNNQYFNFDSNLVVPDDTWTFVALRVRPTDATLFMDDGSGMQSAVNTATHVVESFDSNFVIGADGGRRYTGAIDEVKFYSRALSDAEIASLASGLDPASRPSPTLFQAVPSQTVNLEFSPGSAATSHRIYFGANYADVRDALIGSSVDKGLVSDASWTTPQLNPGAWYWRIDSSDGSNLVNGHVWGFTVTEPGDSILVNFQRFTSEAFAGGALIGPTKVDGSNWNVAADADGSLPFLSDDTGEITQVNFDWSSSNTFGNNDGVTNDERRLASGYLGDGEPINLTFTDIPWAEYKVYGLFASNQNGSGSSGTINFNVNGVWALGGDASTTAAAYGSVNANQAANGEPWTQIVPGSVQGNYWVVETSGSTCSIVGVPRNGSNRGSLTGVIIEKIEALPLGAPAWTSSVLSKFDAVQGIKYTNSLSGDAFDPESDPLTFSVMSGPAWLTVEPDGSIGGIPGRNDLGGNNWTVAVSDDGNTQVTATLTLTVLADFDGDQIPDRWEILYGLNPLVADASSDTDGDGQNNEFEYLADTIPLDGRSQSHISISATGAGGERQLRFITALGRLYTVQYCDDLVIGDWQDLEPTLVGDGTEVTMLDGESSSGRFYRLLITFQYYD